LQARAKNLVLGIESSCDEMAAAVVEARSRQILSSVVASQIETHRPFGGVVPEVASRQHLRDVGRVCAAALQESGVALADLAGVAATCGPGLAGSLLVGLGYAKGLAYFAGLPFLGVNHLEGHLLAAFLEHEDLDFPFVGLVVSGGHSSLYLAEARGRQRLLASTRDDAAGEAFDKVAKMLGLSYPGGPAVQEAAEACAGAGVSFPLAGMKDHSLDFSYSGLKTSVLWHIKACRAAGVEPDVAAVAKGFQAAATDVLIRNTLKACDQEGCHRVVLGGGVAANARLRQALGQRSQEKGITLFCPSIPLCMDNAAMIAYAGGLRLLDGETSGFDLSVSPSLGF
jgi:N6-L-threonylcarbamoyladenine synthase